MDVKIIGDNNYLGNLKEEFFKNRGINNYLDFINLKGFKETNPFEFKNMDTAVDLLIKKQGGNICLIQDSDNDGIASCSELNNYISTYLDYDLKISIHRKKVHGIKIDELEEDGILNWANIIIISDAGSSDLEQHKLLRELYNIDVIIIDHHQTDTRSNDAIVINNQLDGISTNLTGSAMVYKFLQALDITLEENGADDFLDLVALGLIADMADTRDYEVQYLIRKGIMAFKNEFLRTIIDEDYNMKENEISATTLSFSIIPMLNACTRVAEFEEMKLITEAICNIGTDREFEYEFQRGARKGVTIKENLYQHAIRVARSCKSRQDSIVKRAVFGSKRPAKSGILELLENRDMSNDKIIVLDGTTYMEDSGLSGLIANKIMYKYNKPTLVFTKKKWGYLGSGRGEQIPFFRTRLEQTELFKSVQGHEPAFGIRLSDSYLLDDIQEQLNKIFENEKTDAQYVVDFNISTDDLEDYIVDDLARLEEYFGMGLKAPLIYIENMIVPTNSITTGKSNNMLKFVYKDIEFIKFKTTQEEIEKLVVWQEEMCYNIIGKPSINEYQGKRFVQIIIDAIEVVDFESKSIDNLDWSNDDEQDFEW